MFKHFDDVEAFFASRQNYGIKPGLERMLALLNLLNNPHQALQAIHVAGTNGKGSTVNYLKNALKENNYRVGVFQSPSMDDVTGHIFINDERITKEKFMQILTDMYPAICELDEQDNHPTEFEILTVLTFIYFADHVDIAIIEAGMGGRGDTTNCIEPILSIITNVDLDHTAFLGDTLPEIAYQKAGIIKDNTPIVTGEEKEVALKVIQNEALAKDASLYQIHKDFSFQDVKQIKHQQQYQWDAPNYQAEEVAIQMLGDHQLKNSAVVMMALKILAENKLEIDFTKALAGLAKTVVPGRFEKIHKYPNIIIDGAHNPASIDYFMQTVKNTYPSEEKHLIFAAFKDKDIPSMLEELIPYFSTVTITTFDHPRAAPLEKNKELMKYDHVSLQDNWQGLVDAIGQKPMDNNHLYFITGSLHFISLVRNYLLTR